MKQTIAWMAALLILLSLTSCGGNSEKEVDLEQFYTKLADQYGWGEGYMTDISGELLESCYPGLQELKVRQMLVKAPQMSSVVNELALVECETEEDAARAAEIFRKRIADQAGGGAWYPDSMAAWSSAQVYTKGRYAAMIASAEHQDEIGTSFTDLFA